MFGAGGVGAAAVGGGEDGGAAAGASFQLWSSCNPHVASWSSHDFAFRCRLPRVRTTAMKRKMAMMNRPAAKRFGVVKSDEKSVPSFALSSPSDVPSLAWKALN